MKIPGIRTDAFQRGLVRAGTAVWLLGGLALLAATVHQHWMARPAAAAAASPPPAAMEPATARYRPDPSLRSGEELVLVFVGASFCNAQKVPGFPDVIESAKLRLQSQASERGMRFRAVGVALDWRPADGIAFLGHFGEFDEIASGSNWIGDAATRYVWRDIPGDADVPQLLVLRRRIDAERVVRISEDQLVKRVLGTHAIEEWVAGGAAL